MVSISRRGAGWRAAACSNGVRTASTSANVPSVRMAPRRWNTIRRKMADSSCRYANGVELVIRETGWLPLGSCPVRFEGETGWVETGDSGKFVLSSPELLAGRKVAEIGGYPATYHVRDFLDCVKTRSQPKANAEAACYSHITCHAANIAIALNRQLKFDPEDPRIHRRRRSKPLSLGGAARTLAAVIRRSQRGVADRRIAAFPQFRNTEILAHTTPRQIIVPRKITMHANRNVTRRSAVLAAIISLVGVSLPLATTWTANAHAATPNKEAALIEILRSGPRPDKALACKQLAIYGTKQACPNWRRCWPTSSLPPGRGSRWKRFQTRPPTKPCAGRPTP